MKKLLLLFLLLGCRSFDPSKNAGPIILEESTPKLRLVLASYMSRTGNYVTEDPLFAQCARPEHKTFPGDTCATFQPWFRDKGYDLVLRSAFDGKQSDQYAGLLIISPRSMEITENQRWLLPHAVTGFMSLLIFLPLGYPMMSEGCSVTIEGTVMGRAPQSRKVRTYSAAGDSWDAMALYWGYKQQDAAQNACATAIRKALDFLALQVNADSSFLQKELGSVR